MKKLNFIFNLLLFPFLVLKSFSLSKQQNIYSYQPQYKQKEKNTLYKVILLFLLGSGMLFADASNTPDISISPISKEITQGTLAASFTVTSNPAPNKNTISVSYTNSCGANGTIPIGVGDTMGTITIDTSSLTAGDSCSIILTSATGGPSQNDGVITVSTATLTVISAANRDPVANDKSYTTSFETNLTGNVMTDSPADSDPDNDDINVSSNTNPSHGNVIVNTNGSFTYEPDISYDGSDSFTYTISDGNGGTDTATINITVNPTGNSDPIANDKSYTTSFETNLTGNVMTDSPADSDPDNDDINVSSNTNPSHGNVIVNTNGSFTYEPDISYDGPDSFTYTISDGNGGTDTATINITVNPAGNILPPIYQNDYSCGVFTNVLVSYEHIDAGSSANAQACFTENISYPEGELTGEVECTPNACGTATTGCVRQDPPANRYGHNFPINTITGANTPDSDPNPLNDLYYGDISYPSNNAGETIHFDPQTGYQGSSKKVMVIGDLYVKGGYTLSFEPGDYYFDSILIDGNNNEIILLNGGPVRIFVKENYSVAMNNLATNTSAGSKASDLFIYVAGSVIDLSNGGGTANLKAYFYVEGSVTLNNNSNNWEITGGITAEGRININGNNPDFIQDNDADGTGLGDCVLCFEKPEFLVGNVQTKLTNLGGVGITELNITKVYADSFTYNESHIDTSNAGTSSTYVSGVTVDVGEYPLLNTTTHAGIRYFIGSYADRQQDTLYDGTNISFNLSDYNTSTPTTVKALHIADYMDGDRHYHIAVERCGPWPLSSYSTGPFDAWDVFRGDTDSDTFIDDKNISTKISDKDFDLTIANLDSNGTQLEIKSTANTIEYALYDHNGIISGTTGNFDANITTSTTATFVVPHASRIVHVGFKYCSAYDGAVYTLYDDSECSSTSVGACDSISTIATWRVCYSSDEFAVRPEEFYFSNSSDDIELLKSGLNYNFKIVAEKYNSAVETIGYNQGYISQDVNLTLVQTLILNSGIEDNASDPKLNGTLTSSGDTYAFVNGISTSGSYEEVVGISFDDVGIVTIGLKDKKWASIDNDDTPQKCVGGTFDNGLVELDVPEGAHVCGEQNATFIPHHFSANNIHLRDHRDGNFTYLSNDLNMSAHVDANISAMNANNDITQNFRQGSLYYENPVSVDLNVTEWNAAVLGLSTRHPKNVLVDDDHKHDIPTPVALGFGGDDANGTHSIAWNDDNATQKLMFNYERKNNQTVNPFEINGTDINITVDSRYPAIGTTTDGNTANISGSGIGDRNATFFFGRAKSSQFFYDDVIDSVQTPISIVVYCDTYPTCSELNNEVMVNEAYWWLSVDHDDRVGDGNITLTSPPTVTVGIGSPTVAPTDITINPAQTDPGIDSSVVVTGGATTLPMTVEIFLDTTSTTDTSPWLIYNTASDVSDPGPFYKVRFIGQAGWAGHGLTGNVVDSNASLKTNRRLGW